MSTHNLKKIEFNKNLLNWFNQNKRSLPFREDQDPYKIMVSEIMAQQTQISTMIPYFNRFLEKYPTVFDLAESKESDVLSLWEGLGYYSRAKNLRKAAQVIRDLNSFPTDYKEVVKLPGIGPYTAGAILSISFNQKIPAIDGNALRVFTRIYGITNDISNQKTKKEIENIVQEHLDLTDTPGDFNQSIMELGALICIKNKPKCLLCPVKDFCFSFSHQLMDLIPVKSKKSEKRIENYNVLILLKDKKPLFQKRDPKGLLASLYGFPMIPKSDDIENLLRQFKINKYQYVGTSKHIFTHKVWNSDVYIAKIEEIPDGFTNNPKSIPTAFKKMLKFLKK